ncbi:uncharacterized protein A4U43_C04F10060 [Asparagus officinalis]|uniref:Uncharacterized protein n=1 Tax=Asparagus officinalis TaxID=4686 RepID=A0A5P1F4J6_ASPOF|nr:uncharacterized protein A4U43_C04F10060 [Asparagus officinalis]
MEHQEATRASSSVWIWGFVVGEIRGKPTWACLKKTELSTSDELGRSGGPGRFPTAACFDGADKAEIAVELKVRRRKEEGFSDQRKLASTELTRPRKLASTELTRSDFFGNDLRDLGIFVLGKQRFGGEISGVSLEKWETLKTNFDHEKAFSRAIFAKKPPRSENAYALSV